jgi:hypothetical protein
MTVDWTRPIETLTGHEAYYAGPSGAKWPRRVCADWEGEGWAYRNMPECGHSGNYGVRNVRQEGER